MRLHLHEISLTLQKVELTFWFSFCKSLEHLAITKLSDRIIFSDRKIPEKIFILAMVYIISHLSTFCIRNSKAALVMIVGIVPLGDLQASSYAYKM